MKTNVANPRETVRTAEGALAQRANNETQLRRSVATCLLFEDNHYEDGVAIADRIRTLIPKVKPEKVAALALEARTRLKLRHIPLFLVREMARTKTHQAIVADTLSQIVQRADELSEFVALYWKDGRQTLSAQVKRGLARAFTKFDEYALAKYNREAKVKLRDVLFLCHAKPENKKQAALWKRLINDGLKTPDTWEVELSDSKDKKASWSRLLEEDKLGALALLRNLRNMQEAGVPAALIRNALKTVKVERVLPYRFISAAKYAPKFEPELEAAMIKCLESQEKLPGKTVLIIDVSGSMRSPISQKSDLSRIDVAGALAILLREICEDVVVYATGTTHALVPARRGFALREALTKAQGQCGGGGIYLNEVTKFVKDAEKEADRVIVITDEEDCGSYRSNPNAATAFGDNNYLINVSSAQYGVAYNKFTHVHGWSESVIDFIRELEAIE